MCHPVRGKLAGLRMGVHHRADPYRKIEGWAAAITSGS
jgi:hypothetical protein